MRENSQTQNDFKQFRKAALRAHRIIAEDLQNQGGAPEGEIVKSARVLTYRLLFFLAAACRGLMGIPDHRKSQRPFMQNIFKLIKENPPHARMRFSFCDLFEPSRQPYLWRLHPSDEAVRQAIDVLVPTSPEDWRVVWPGDIYAALLDPEERRDSGSYYTPDSVVKYIVAQAVGHICYKSPDRKKGVRSADEILAARVIDPAMGDGRFIIACVDYLADALAESRGEAPSTTHRVEIARRCVYGIDQDRTVVDIARIALWLHLGGVETDTSFLRRRLQSGDALLGATLDDVEKSLESAKDKEDLSQSQMGLFKSDAPQPQAYPTPLRKFAESGRMIERIRSLANLWTSFRMGDESAAELYNPARLNITRASDEKWAEIEAHPIMQAAHRKAAECSFVHWEIRFPDVFFPKDNRPSGFSAVVGNPPYRRERDSGESSASRLSPVAQKWGESKMDLIALFIHRGLDLLAAGGRLSFITSSYWLHAEGARRLRKRLVEDFHVLNFMDVGGAPIFQGLTGRHCFVNVVKESKSQASTTIFTLKSKYEKSGEAIERLGENIPEYFEIIEIHDQRRLMDEDGTLHLGDRDVEAVCRKMEKRSIPLGDITRSSQGIVDNPPELREKTISKMGELTPDVAQELNYKVGEHVFALPPDHPLLSEMNGDEKKLLRPFYRPSSIRSYGLPDKPDAYLLYLTPNTCPDIEAFPNVKRHMERYRPVLELRRETKEGRMRWWHLHWAREAGLFDKEHLLAPQMTQAPMTARSAGQAYAGMSVNVISDPERVSLPFVEALINSRAVGFLMDNGVRAKRRGLRLDITLSALRKIPVPAPERRRTDDSVKTELGKLMEMYRKTFKDEDA